MLRHLTPESRPGIKIGFAERMLVPGRLCVKTADPFGAGTPSVLSIAAQALGSGISLTVEESAGASLPNHFLWMAASVPSFFIALSASLSLPSSG